MSRSHPPAYAVYTPKRKHSATNSTSSKTSVNLDNEDRESEEESGEKKQVGTKDKLLLSADLVLTTLDDSARRVFDVTADRLGAVVGHK